MTRSIPFGKPWIIDADRDAVMEVLRGDVLTHGPQGKAFEEEFAKFVGDEAYCISTSSGMAALHLTYLQLGIGAGDEVIVTAQTHTATAHAVEAVGAACVFVDCEGVTGNVDISQIEKKITSRTKAIALVHFLAIPCDMDAILSIANKHNLKVIEDCALAVGARYKGKHVGLFGDAGCFSFYPVKHITTGDGGMFITRHRSLAEKILKLRAFGVDRTFAERTVPGMYDVPTWGLNYRMSDINAALGRKQIERIDEILKRRRANFTHLKTALLKLSGVSVIDSNNTNTVSTHYCLSVVLEGELGKKRNSVISKLNQAGIGTSVMYPQPVPRMTYYQKKYGYRAEDFPQATRISDQSIALPVGPHVTTDDITYIANTFVEVLKEI
jgi:dTDP-4-amino-4,6-dideoxygalactose transaminase